MKSKGLRQNGEYEDFVKSTKEEAEKQFKEAEYFVNAVLRVQKRSPEIE